MAAGLTARSGPGGSGWGWRRLSRSRWVTGRSPGVARCRDVGETRWRRTPAVGGRRALQTPGAASRAGGGTGRRVGRPELGADQCRTLARMAEVGRSRFGWAARWPACACCCSGSAGACRSRRGGRPGGRAGDRPVARRDLAGGKGRRATWASWRCCGCSPRACPTVASPTTWWWRARHGQEARDPLLGKLGAADRTEAAARARQLGLIP